MPNFCKYCGDPVSAGELFCDKCGKRIGLLAGGVPYLQNSRNLDMTQKICYDVACQRQFRAEQVKGK